MPSSPASETGTAPEEEAASDDERAGDREGRLERQCAELEDRWKRALADLDNYRKRSGREVERQVAERTERMARDWLEVVDSIDRAMASEAAPENPLAAGLRAVHEQIEATLDRYGIERVGAVGEPFDPALHEAVGIQETTAQPENTIVDVTRAGYGMGDRLLRPAQVVVSRRPSAEA
jgi:molecular chaperone GrpE